MEYHEDPSTQISLLTYLKIGFCSFLKRLKYVKGG